MRVTRSAEEKLLVRFLEKSLLIKKNNRSLKNVEEIEDDHDTTLFYCECS